MKALTILTALMILTVPISIIIDQEADGSEMDIRRFTEPWTVIPEPKSESPWWERTSMDVDGNGISDSIDPYLEKELKIDVILSYSRDIKDTDKEYLSHLGYRISSHIINIDALVIGGVPAGRIETLLNAPGAIFIEPLGNPILFSDIATPTVKAKQSDLFSPETAWDLGYSGSGVSIAVIDTGIDDEHPSLDGKFIGGVDMTKPDNLPFLYPQDGSYNPDDIQGHGSTCSGIATGTGDPENQYQGTAPSARLVDVRIGTKIGYAPGEFWVGAVSDPHVKDGTLRGIDWAIEHRDDNWGGAGEYEGIDIFSISWGVDIGWSSDGSDAYSRLLDEAVQNDVIVVNAAGNDGPDNDGFHGLSASSSSIIVAAADDRNTMEHDDDVVAFYSSRGPRTDDNDEDPYDELIPDVAAPGTNITNLQPDTQRVVGDASDNGYGNRGSGTSYATPTVAGVVALILEANPELEGRPYLVEEILKATAERMKPPSYPELDPFWEGDFGYGQVDAYKAVRVAEELEAPDSIDVNLQAHITKVGNFNSTHNGTVTSQYAHFNITGPTEVGGLGWSRIGGFDNTEYRIDDGDWRPIPDQSNESFNPWTLEISGLGDGSDHRLWVRSVNGDEESLPSWIDFTYNSAEGEVEGLIGGGILTPLIIIGLLAALGVGVFIWYNRKKINR